ncbi:MAG: hypothetical protein WCA19_01940 [Candidatus Acidiferrales bacterium]
MPEFNDTVSDQTETPSFPYGFHCLAYLDILGQRRKLRQLSRIPKDDPETVRLLRETAGAVLRLRDLAHTCFETLQKVTPFAASLPPDVQQRIREGKESVKTLGFSDSFIMWVPFGGDEKQVRSIIGVYSCLAACCLLQLTALCEGRPIRGGIEVGPGLELSDAEVYGPVLEKAHFIESTLADYPRIVVGEELLKYLDVVGPRMRATPLGPTIEALASHARRLVTQDSDGLWMLDFLGERVSELSKAEVRQRLFAMAQNYIDEQKQIGYDTQDYQHLSRYFRLGAYFEERAARWNESDVSSPA